MLPLPSEVELSRAVIDRPRLVVELTPGRAAPPWPVSAMGAIEITDDEDDDDTNDGALGDAGREARLSPPAPPPTVEASERYVASP